MSNGFAVENEPEFMELDRYKYFLRRLLTLRPEDPLLRLRSLIRHRREKSRYGFDPGTWDPQRLWESRDEWLTLGHVADVAGEVNRALLAALPKGTINDESFWRSFSGLYPSEASRLISSADAIRAGRIKLFQWKEIEFSDPIEWSASLDPDQPGEEWPAEYYADLGVHHDPARPTRDVRWCWELNRFQHLLHLGAAWRLTGDRRYAQSARNHMESWMNQAIYPLGVCWNSNLEVGLRALAWARCHGMCLNSESWDHGFVERLITWLHIHGSHLANELTEHHTHGNHLLGEASSLFCLGVMYPLFSDAAAWRTRAARIINRLGPELILPDGVYAEQTTGYFRFVAEFLFQVLQFAAAQGAELCAVLLERLYRGLIFAEALRGNAADVPMIGDSDTGLAIGWRLADFWDFTPLLAAGAVLLDKPALARGMEEFPSESYLLLGDDGLRTFSEAGHCRTLPAGPSQTSSGFLNFEYGGYQISRDESFNVVLDCGGLGIAPSYGHGHCDGLSFVMDYQGRSVAVDPGTDQYNGPVVWRDYFRGTAAHNTMRIDGKEQSRPAGTFRWSGPFDIHAGIPCSGNGWRLLSGCLNQGEIVHRRFVIHLLEQAVIIMDEVKGAGEHELEWFFHFDPACRVEQVASGVFKAFSEESVLDIVLCQGSDKVTVLRGSERPPAGWYSRYYGHKVPAVTLTRRRKAVLPACAVTAFVKAGQSVRIPRDLLSSPLPTELLELLKSTFETPIPVTGQGRSKLP